MKILLLSNTPPCRNWTSGLVLDQFSRFLPPESLACFVVTGLVKNPELSPELASAPIAEHPGPRQHIPQFRFAPARLAASLAVNAHLKFRGVPHLVDHAVAFARSVGADLLWSVLEGPALIQAALPIAERLGIPLVTLVFDPPHWWLDNGRFDPFSARRIHRQFERTVRRSRCCAAASWAMAEEYQTRYGVSTVPFFSYFDPSALPPVAREPRHPERFVLGFAGKIYAPEAWQALLTALDSVGWRIAGRDVSIRVIGRNADEHFPARLIAERRIERIDWLEQTELIRALSETDLGYCPYRFDSAFEPVARLSFPSKLISYLAAGRPVLFHGPAYSSPARFLESHQAGLCCTSLAPDELVRRLQPAAFDPTVYAAAAARGREAFLRFFTLDACRSMLSQYFGAAEDFLLPTSRLRPLAA